jgi:hypothetical protein
MFFHPDRSIDPAVVYGKPHANYRLRVSSIPVCGLPSVPVARRFRFPVPPISHDEAARSGSSVQIAGRYSVSTSTSVGFESILSSP